MKQSKYSYLKFGAVLAIGALLALVLCIQCVRTYLYADAVLVPQQAEHEAERQGGAISIAARSAGITDPRALRPAIEHALDSASERVLWIRVLDPEGNVLSSGGTPQRAVQVPTNWWERVEKHESLATVVTTTKGKTVVALLPFRMPRPPRPVDPSATSPAPEPAANRPAFNGRRGGGGALLVEVAIPLSAVRGAFDGLRQNLILGLIASIALLLAVAVIGLRTPRYLRGKYLESELELAKRVQGDLQPKPLSLPSHVEFAASAIAADHVGGDFYDIFETDSGKVGIVLGDVSGKGVSAALLVSVIQGAIRSSTVSGLETACERINRMLCERTACERFATLFWGVFDPETGRLSYVNAGHAAPMLVRRGGNVQRLSEGGPVLGLLPFVPYSVGAVDIETTDTLVLYSDGINEAANEHDVEFGEQRLIQMLSRAGRNFNATAVCQQIMHEVQTFAKSGPAPDDRTLLLVRFPGSGTGHQLDTNRYTAVEAVA